MSTVVKISNDSLLYLASKTEQFIAGLASCTRSQLPLVIGPTCRALGRSYRIDKIGIKNMSDKLLLGMKIMDTLSAGRLELIPLQAVAHGVESVLHAVQKARTSDKLPWVLRTDIVNDHDFSEFQVTEILRHAGAQAVLEVECGNANHDISRPRRKALSLALGGKPVGSISLRRLEPSACPGLIVDALQRGPSNWRGMLAIRTSVQPPSDAVLV